MRVFLSLVIILLLTSCSNNYAEYVQPVSPENLPTKNPVPETPITVLATETPPPSQEIPTEKYPIHQNIYTTYFYIGETATDDNGYIPNDMSAWDEQWQQHYGGVDDPHCRNGYNPCFTPKENPFYCALPYSDFDRVGRKSNIDQIYWYNDETLDDKISLVKNRWVKITFNDKTAYCQWEDAGPFHSDNVDYVFGAARPLNEQENPDNQAGLDVSPAVKDYLGLDGYDQTNWQFVDSAPSGPWKEVVTSSGTNWK